MDMSDYIAAKSDQLNADDLIGGPRTIRITKVTGTGNPEQPVAVYFEGDDGKPWKVGKSMRRAMVHLWGPNAASYAGRSLTLYRDPKVKFGGMEVGGIRISHASDIPRDMSMALTATKGQKKLFEVKRLVAEAPKMSNRERMFAAAREAAGRGEKALAAFVVTLLPPALDALKPILAELNATAAKIPAHDPDTGEVPGNDPADDDAERDYLPDDDARI